MVVRWEDAGEAILERKQHVQEIRDLGMVNLAGEREHPFSPVPRLRQVPPRR